MVRSTSTGQEIRQHLRIVEGYDQEVGLWLLDRLPEVTDLPGGFTAAGVARGHELVGGCLFTDYHPCPGGGVIQMWAAGDPGWVSRRVVRTMLGYPLNQLKCHRITALTAKSNKPSRRLLEGLGFALEGVARQGFGPRRHACIYGLLKDEAAKWITRG